MVNGFNMVNATHAEAATAINSATPICHLVILRVVLPTEEGDGGPAVTVEEEGNKSKDAAMINDEENYYPIEHVVLDRSIGRLGLSIVGGSDHVSRVFGQGKPGVYISKISKGGSAMATGKLKLGDRILEVNKSKISNYTHQQAVQCLVSQEGDIELLVQHVPQPPGIKEVHLEKGPNQKLGLSIRGGGKKSKGNPLDPNDAGIFVSEVTEGGVAEHCGLAIGMRIIEVNGISLLGASHLEAIKALTSSDELTITVCDGFDVEEALRSGSESDVTNDLTSKRGNTDGANNADSDLDATEDFIRGVKEAIFNNDTIDRKHAHSMFVGPPGSGKSSLMDRLLRRIRKGRSLSTGLSERVIIVDIDIDNPSTFHSVTVIDSNTWKEVEYDISLVRQMNKVSTVTSPPPPPEQSVQPKKEHEEITTLPAASSVKPEPAQAKLLIASRTELSDGEIRGMINAVVKKCGGYKEFRNFLTKSYSLYLRDTGGQVEFQEMISLLIFGPSIFFFVFRIDLEFQSKFSVEYRASESESTNCYTSSITTEEALLQCLASVYAMDTPGKAGVKTHKPLVFIVGTHKDKLDRGDEKIAKLNAHLNSLILENGFQDLVQYSNTGKGQVMFTVDNTSESDEDFELIRLRVHSLISGRKEFTIEYPISYLLFCLELQNLKRSVLSLDECKAIAAKYGIVGDQVSHLLQFLHLRIGVIQYFDLDGLRHIVVKEPQVLFNKVTSLVVKTFSCEALTTKEQKDFQKGIVTASAFESVVSSEDEITCQEFLKLLVHLRIITPYPSTDPEDQEERYFIPCVLNHVQESSEEALHTNILPLSIHFQCSHCPKGLFGVLVTHLMTPESDEEPDSNHPSFTLMQDKIYKDQVSFEVHSTGVHDEMSLKAHLSHLEINFYPETSEDRDTPVDKVCSVVREIVGASITRSLRNLHYNEKNLKPVMCLRCEHCSESHPVEKGRQHYKIYCKEVRKTSCIPAQGKFWYSEDVGAASSATCSASNATTLSTSDEGSVATLDFQVRVSSLPASAHPHLKQILDWDHEGVDKDLIVIAYHMLDWEEKLSSHLELTEVDVHDITRDIRLTNPELQRREALRRWKNNQGLQATYGNLLELLLKAGHTKCAEAVCEVLRRK